MHEERYRSNAADGQMLPPAALRYENLRTIAAAFPIAGLLTVAALLVDIEWVAFMALWVLLPVCVLSVVIDCAIVNRLQLRAYRYVLRDSTIDIRRGVFMRSTTTVSTIQVLTVDVVQGPLLRSCGLVAVVLHTIGGTIRLGPLTPAGAEVVRARVARALEAAPR